MRDVRLKNLSGEQIVVENISKSRPSFFRLVAVIRQISAWVALGASVSLLVVIAVIYFKYPYPYYVPSPPAAPRWMIGWRNWSLVSGFVASLLSLPKWQSLVALPATVLLFFFSVYTAD